MTGDYDLSRDTSVEAARLAFLLDLLDERHDVEDALREKFTESEVTTADYRSSAALPDALQSFAGMTGKAAEFGVSSRVVRTEDSRNLAGAASLTISPEDRLPFTLTNDHGLITIEQGDDFFVDGTGALFRDTLRSLFATPANKDKLARTSDLVLLDVIATLSPTIERYYEYREKDAERTITIQWMAAESADDSKETIRIELVRPHACEANVGTRLTLQESLLRRMSDITGDDVNQTTDIIALYGAADDELTVEEILNGGKNRIIPVRKLTPYHMSDVLDALQALKQAQL